MIRTVPLPVTLCLYALSDQAYDRGNFRDVITLLASYLCPCSIFYDLDWPILVEIFIAHGAIYVEPKLRTLQVRLARR